MPAESHRLRPRDAFPFFAGGIGAFLVGHIFYLVLFGGRSWKGLSAGRWALAGALLFTFSDSCIAMGTFGVMNFAVRLILGK